MTVLTKDYVSSILEYHPISGTFTWKVSRGTVKAGRAAGSKTAGSYYQIKINKKYYKVHRLVWLMEHGELPKFPLDHIDGNGLNNPISNLRRCTMSQNKANSRSYKNNKSGIKGVHWNRHLDRWTASIQCNGKRHFLGVFKTKEEAADCYMATAVLLFGQFARAA